MNPSRYNVIWNTPSPDASGSMPLGNGANAINLWVEPSGDIRLYLARTDSWGEFGQLYKVGRVRISLKAEDGSALLTGEGFRWELKLEEGAIHVLTRKGQAKIWVDAHHPVVRIEAEGESPITGRVTLEPWRRERRELSLGNERHGLHQGATYPVYHDKDHILAAEGTRIAWVHHNQSSSWENCIRQQGLETLLETETDPLLNRCFGGMVFGPELEKVSPTELCSVSASAGFEAGIVLHTTHPGDPDHWLQETHSLTDSLPDASTAWTAHFHWWSEFWGRSWIEADGCEAARKISRGYALQRFMNACAGRGEFPIKFNGSLFTVDWNYDGSPHIGGERFDADYRRWGPGYWHQNTRLPYWSMLSAGDFESMRPYFELYRKALPAARERVRRFCGHPGATFIETMYFWGAYLENNYGWTEGDSTPQRDPGLPGHLCQNQYIRLHNSSGLEVVYHALLFHRYTGDDTFLQETALPLAEEVLAYYDHHFPRKDGKLHITPAQVIEQWWVAENPMPEIAGLHACLNALLRLPNLPNSLRGDWEHLRGELPELPTGNIDGKTVFTPAETWEGPPRNSENPQLYAIFPYHHCHLLGDSLQTGIETFRRRTYTHDQGWAQDGMQAALLGLEGEARNSVANRLTTPSAYARFPAFWGPSFDWIPDQDQGGSASHALQLMLMQVHGDTVLLLPAWPDHWPVHFKLAGPYQTCIVCEKTPGHPPVWEVLGEQADRLEILISSEPPSSSYS